MSIGLLCILALLPIIAVAFFLVVLRWPASRAMPICYVESFNSKLRDEFLNRELFLDIDELRYVADRWRMDYNHYRPHSSLGYMSPAAFAGMVAKNPSGPQPVKLPPDCPPICPAAQMIFYLRVLEKTLIQTGTKFRGRPL